VQEGEIVSLVGANGAGKSTLMKTVLGIQHPVSGSILFMGHDITRHSTDRIVASGLAYVPEGSGVFPFMTVMENLKLGAINVKGGLNERIKEAFMRFPILEKRQNSEAKTLSGGERQMLAINRAIMATPALLMLDEPSMGLAPMVIREVFKFVFELMCAGYTILLSEQNAKISLECCNRAYVFETGKIILQGTSEELLRNKDVQRAYLG
jgi:branched-chain amino acid transport system ATP-binding protein